MRRFLRGWLAAFLLIGMTAVAVGCGGGDSGGSSSSGSSSSGGSQTEGKQGGNVTFLAAGDVDYLDPGQTYYTFGYMVQLATNRTLYSFPPGETTTPENDLAEAPPEISEDNKTLTIKIKKGVKYAPPVDREVTSKDIKYAIERAFTSNVASGYATSYFAEIEGAPKAPVKYSELKPFSGLETPDDNTLIIKLTSPVAQRVAGALVMPITVPVPEEYAKKYDQESPSTYDQYVAFTGPYMVKNDAQGKVTGRQAGRKIEIVRNPNWDKSTDFRPAYLDSITIEEGNDDLTVASRRTLTGTTTLCCDSGQPPIPVLRQALSRNKDQVAQTPSGGTRWIALNSTIKPLDNVNVRRALVAAFDRTALRNTRGGEAIGPVAQGFIPPGIPGFEESGGEKGFSDVDFMQNPNGDLELAKKYMLAAKKDGVPDISDDGMYTGSELFTIATNADPGAQTAQTALTEFEKLGFKLNFRQVPQDTLYTKFCGVPDRKVAVCPNVGWFKDFNDPESLLQPTFSGNAIKPAGNVNWSQLDDSAINEAMQKAALTSGDARAQAWADVNKQIVEQAPGIPYSWDDSVSLESPDMNGVANEYNTTWDLSHSSLK